MHLHGILYCTLQICLEEFILLLHVFGCGEKLWRKHMQAHTVRHDLPTYAPLLLSLSSDLFWVSFPPPLAARSCLLWRGGEADGFSIWAPCVQNTRCWDAHPSWADVPRSPPHVAPARGWWSRWFHWDLQLLSHSNDQEFVPESFHQRPVWSHNLFSHCCFG